MSLIRLRFQGCQVLAASFLGLAMASVVGGQQAQAVTISFTAGQLPELCGAAACQFDVLQTAPINYTELNTTYPPSQLGYNYDFQNTLLAIKFLNAYQSLVPAPANTGGSGFGELPAEPGVPGGPLFYTGIGTSTIIPGTSVTTAYGQYYTTTATNFSSNQGGMGLLAADPKQNQIWAVFKCTGGGCVPVPAPLPILGAGTALGYSRRLRRRVEAS
jgi:hypothetical protein